MTPFDSIDEARRAIEAYAGDPADFLLPIADDLQDAVGLTMAVLMDAILAKGWEPDGFEQRDGYRLYRYKFLE